MKLALNGAASPSAPRDGANIEIRDRVGADKHSSSFGLERRGGPGALRAAGYDPYERYRGNPALRQGDRPDRQRLLSRPTRPNRFRPIVEALLGHGDQYLLLRRDFAAYVECQARGRHAASLARRNGRRKAVLNIAGMGPFSSDRAIREYAAGIWNVRPAGGGDGLILRQAQDEGIFCWKMPRKEL